MTMESMFQSAQQFDQDIGGWDTSAVTTMAAMFFSASAFNQDIGDWNTSKVTTMRLMFRETLVFNNGGEATIGGWVTSNLADMGNMFQGAAKFNQDLSRWTFKAVPTNDGFDTNTTAWVKPKPNFIATP